MARTKAETAAGGLVRNQIGLRIGVSLTTPAQGRKGPKRLKGLGLGLALVALAPYGAVAETAAPTGQASGSIVTVFHSSDTAATDTKFETTKVGSADPKSDSVPPSPASPPTVKAAPVAAPRLTLGAEFFFGATNVTGPRARSTDGLWAGSGTAYPSTISGQWQAGETRVARVSIGVGDLYTGSGTKLRQPVEAFYQLPAGSSTLTVGKYYVPFAAQEWEYETRYGVMLQTAQGSMSYTASVNYNFNSDSPNLYLRAGRQWKGGASLGISAGAGRGLLYDTSHALALGVDARRDFGGLEVSSEYVFAHGDRGDFQFAFGKLTLTRLGRLQPYAATYYWHDQAQEAGGFQSAVLGLNYKLTAHLALEGAYARGSNRDIVWLQSHVTL